MGLEHSIGFLTPMPLQSKQNNYQWDKISIIMSVLDYLIRQNDQISISMPECDNVNTDGQDDE